jgi:hypothetical protein
MVGRPGRPHRDLDIAELPALPAGRDPLATLAAQDMARVQELLPIRYGRMAVSPFTFYRGAAAVMAADLAATPTSGITVQLCGDAHLSNFGLFASPERRLVFDINDFDETLRGPWEWDVKRLLASVEVAARDRGFATRERRAAVESAARTYRETMHTFAERPTLDVWYAFAEADHIKALLTPQLKTRAANGWAAASPRPAPATISVPSTASPPSGTTARNSRATRPSSFRCATCFPTPPYEPPSRAACTTC